MAGNNTWRQRRLGAMAVQGDEAAKDVYGSRGAFDDACGTPHLEASPRRQLILRLLAFISAHGAWRAAAHAA